MDSLLRDRHYVSVWSRRPGSEKRDAVGSFYWDPMQGEPSEESLNDFDAVVHLAGEPVAQRWTPEVKHKIRDSRVLGTRRLVDAIAKVKHPPSTLICASAIGYYGARGDQPVDETSPPGSGFLAEACQEWEREADRAREFGLRVMKVRIGIVLGAEGGALKAMLPAFRAFAGGKLGSGKQWMSWIQLDDLISMFRRALDSNLSGVWNGTAPNPVTNAQFTAELARVLGKPALLQIPPFALKLLFGELADTMLTGTRVLPRAAEANGFVWKYPDLPAALAASGIS
ncbi:MAG: hypothetical protein JWO80_6399 [Bryobacterales bacterium]|nr:hypothetical protein [Bryobacterales bacterium]